MGLYFNDEVNSLAANCEACGQEFLRSELKSIKVASMSIKLLLCEDCEQKDTAEDFSSVVKDLDKLFNGN